ncbi:phosphoribosyltransferase-like protein, partial [Xanthomonas axonopodis]
MNQTFITRDAFSDFLSNLITNVHLAGNDPRSYWARANILNIQIDGRSQKEMIDIFGDALRNKLDLALSQCGADGGDYIYFDDVIFSGGRVGTDLQSWISNSAPASATVHVIVIAYHLLGQYYADNRVKEAARAANKNIHVKYWRGAEIENRKYQKDNSAVLWPVAIPNDAATQAYQAHLVTENKFPLIPRTAGGALNIFSSEAGRQVLENEFLIAGVKIRSRMGNLSEWYRPLGCSSFGVGFGSLFATYRNCPNNC